jgi:very-short-patch-repair endonuclease
LIFDFWIPDLRICIEFDGKQHFEPIEWFGGVDKYETSKVKDAIKNKYCADNDIKLIRISYKDYSNIEKILNDEIK